MPTTSPPILVWTPGGGVPVGPISNPPVYSQAGTTQLVEGQAYVDVVFGSIQTDDDWVLVACEVENTTDFEPLNIWPGIITDKTTAGFRIYLNGMPDSGNYYLRWAVSGVNIAPVPATSYQLLGPTSGTFGVDDTFTVKLFPSTTLGFPVVVTPDDGGDGGTFYPSSVTLTSDSPVKTFTYNAASFGVKTISVTNDNILTDPASITYTIAALEYALVGPSGGDAGVESTNFAVSIALEATLPGPVTITPDDGGAGGTFTPTTVELDTGSLSQYFTYTPSAPGDVTISTTNDGGLIDPDSLTYVVDVAPLADGDPVGTWADSSGNGHDATNTGSARPIFKTAILNGKPVVRFTAAGLSRLNLASAISSVGNFTFFAVMKPSASSGVRLLSLATSTAFNPMGIFGSNDGAGTVFIGDRTNYYASPATGPLGEWRTAFHVLSGRTLSIEIYRDGNLGGTTSGANAATANFDIIGAADIGGAVGGPYYSDGDIAEIIAYNANLSDTNRANIEKGLGTKYAITVAGGTAIQPDDAAVVANLVGWWKADSLG